MEKTYNLTYANMKFKLETSELSILPSGTKIVNGVISRNKRAHIHSKYEIFIITEEEMELNTNYHSSVNKKSAIIIPPNLHHYTQFRNAKVLNLFGYTSMPLLQAV